MLKYYKEYFSDFLHADVLQTIILIGSIFFFVSILLRVLRKPKNYYKETSELPLQDEDPMF